MRLSLHILHIFLVSALAAHAARAGFTYFDPLDSAAVPKRISGTGFFSDLPAKTAAPGAVRYEINAALWSDGAAKIRYLILPPDSQAVYREDTAFRFPKGAVFVKNFLIDTIQGDTASRIFLETRFLLKRNPDDSSGTHWYGFSYRWLRDQSDAVLVDPRVGLDTSITTYTSQGDPVPKRWLFPSQSLCWRCHMPQGREILGFVSAELNRPDAAGTDQLQALAGSGILRGAPPDPARAHRWAALTDASQSLERRARSYLAANCSFCHGAEGRRVIGTVLSAVQDFDYYKPDAPVNYLNVPAKFDYGIPGSLLLFGGDPGRSIILHRMRSRPQYQMPPLATAEPDTTALRVLSEWAATLTAPANAVRPPGRHSAADGAYGAYGTYGARILGAELWLEDEAPRAGGVGLISPHGKHLALRPKGPRRFALPAGMGPGMYYVCVPGKAPRAVVKLP